MRSGGRWWVVPREGWSGGWGTLIVEGFIIASFGLKRNRVAGWPGGCRGLELSMQIASTTVSHCPRGRSDVADQAEVYSD